MHIKSALISVFYKNGLEKLVPHLKKHNIDVYSTGGTYDHLLSLGLQPIKVEDVTGYPSILDGRVKTLHPKVFGGILAKREEDHLSQLDKFEIPAIDLVVVDLYPFEETLKSTDDEGAIIEKIDIGGISLIRAAAKNFRDVLIIPAQDQYGFLEEILSRDQAQCSLEERKKMAAHAFAISSHYDTAIFNYFNASLTEGLKTFKVSYSDGQDLRYGENPHQSAKIFGNLDEILKKISGKDMSYNNLVDIDSAMQVMAEFQNSEPTYAILKHTNTCGLATRSSGIEAWKAALAGDPISAFGGIIISNTTVDIETAREINQLFYEVLLAPRFSEEALDLLTQKKKRILIEIQSFERRHIEYKSLLNGMVYQDLDLKMEHHSEMNPCTTKIPDDRQYQDLVFANKVAKHLKSNTIVLVKDQQLLGMGCGQTSRIDACHQAIDKAKRMGFELNGSVMASDAFFPFPDCVEAGFNAGIKAVVQPGGSVNDHLSIDFCNTNDMAMVLTGTRHFKH